MTANLNVFGGRNPALAPVWAAMAPRRGMHPADITAGLKKAGSSQVSVARALGITQQVVCQVIAGRKNSFRTATFIASMLGRSIDDIWPGRYGRSH